MRPVFRCAPCFLISVILLLTLPSAAGATALCPEATEGSCEAPYEVESPFSGKSKNVTLVTSLGTIACSESVIEGELELGATSEGESLPVWIEHFTFQGCTREKESCTLSASHIPYETSIEYTEKSNGTFELTGSEEGTPGISVLCGKSINCTASGEPSLAITGGAAGTANLEASSEPLTPSGPTCFEKANWSGKYTLDQPGEGSVFVAQDAPGTRLCSSNANNPCAGGDTYGFNSTLKAELESANSVFTVEITEGAEKQNLTISCSGSTFTILTNAAEGIPLPAFMTQLAFTPCAAPCSATPVNVGYVVLIKAIGGGNGKVEIKRGSNLTAPPRIRVKCNGTGMGLFTCAYESTNALNNIISAKINGGQPAKLEVNATLGQRNAESDTKCGPQLEWKATYKFTQPTFGGAAKMWVIQPGV